MKKTALLLLLVLNFHISFGQSLFQAEDFDKLAYNETTFNKILNQEKKLYNDTKHIEHLLNIRYVEASIFAYKGNITNRVIKLLWIIEHARESDCKIKTYALMGISSGLSFLGSYNQALKYSDQALKSIEKYKMDSLFDSYYSNLGLIQYKLQNYKKAEDSFQNAIRANKTDSLIFTASMLNNISLCKLKFNDVNGSNDYLNRSLAVISQIKQKSFYVREFKVIVEGNLGSNYFKQKRFEFAKPLLEQEIAFYEKSEVAFTNAKNPLEQLLKIYLSENNATKVKEILTTIKQQERISTDKIVSNSFTEILYEYYSDINDITNYKIYSKKLIYNTSIIKDSIENNLNKINSNQ